MGRCLTSVTANAEVDCSRIRNETVVSVSWLPLNIALGCLASTIRLEKKQSVQIGDEGVKLSIRSCRDQHRRMLMESTVKLLEEIARSASLQGTEQCSKSMVLLYTSKNNRKYFYIPLAVVSKNIKQLSVNLTKDVQELTVH